MTQELCSNWQKHFLKQFKTGEDLYNFLGQLQKRGLEKILEGELDAHLRYEKHIKRQLPIPIMAFQTT